MDFILHVKNLGYDVKETNVPNKRLKILSDINFNLERGKILGIAGESGSGKTTLAKLVAGLLPPSTGEIKFYFENDVKKNRTNPVQVLFQNSSEILNPMRKVKDILEEAVLIGLGVLHKEQVNGLIESLQIKKELMPNRCSELSGGEQQRIALARVIAVKPKLLILDEPFSGQDVESQLNLLKLFKEIKNKFNLSLICISHNLAALKNIADNLMIMYNGEIVELDSTKNIFYNSKHPYTKFLLKAENYNLSLGDFNFNK